jgi:hypothetical protein
MAPPKAEDTLVAPETAERFTETIIDALTAGAVKVEVFAFKKKVMIRIIWQ